MWNAKSETVSVSESVSVSAAICGMLIVSRFHFNLRRDKTKRDIKVNWNACRWHWHWQWQHPQHQLTITGRAPVTVTVADPLDTPLHVQMAGVSKIFNWICHWAVESIVWTVRGVSSEVWVVLLTVQRYHVLHFRVTVIGLIHVLLTSSLLCCAGAGKGVCTQRHFHGTQCGQVAGQSTVLQLKSSDSLLKLDTNE